MYAEMDKYELISQCIKKDSVIDKLRLDIIAPQKKVPDDLNCHRQSRASRLAASGKF